MTIRLCVPSMALGSSCGIHGHEFGFLRDDVVRRNRARAANISTSRHRRDGQDLKAAEITDGRRQVRLISLRINSRITAPMKASMIAAMIPLPITIPRRGSSQPAMTAPTMPTTMSADQAKAAATHDLPGEPARDRSHDQPDDDCFECHFCSSPASRKRARSVVFSTCPRMISRLDPSVSRPWGQFRPSGECSGGCLGRC